MIDLLIKPLFTLFLLSITTVGCSSNHKEHGIIKNKVKTDTFHKNETIIHSESNSKNQNKVRDTLPTWLKQRFPDSISIDYSYGFTTNEITTFKHLNNEVHLIITSWSDGLCVVDSAFTFQSKDPISSVEIGRACDNPEPNLNYEHTDYKIMSNNVIQSTTYSETLPDSIYEIAQDNLTYSTSKYKEYEETLVEYSIDEKWHIIKN